jgi:hypothetical protein
MRTWLAAGIWLAAIAALVIGIGMRVAAARLADPAQTLRGFLADVPAEVGAAGRVVHRDRGQIQVELDLDAVWARRFAQRNGFTPIDGQLFGMAAERWMLQRESDPRGTVLLLAPAAGGPLQVTFMPAGP